MVSKVPSHLPLKRNPCSRAREAILMGFRAMIGNIAATAIEGKPGEGDQLACALFAPILSTTELRYPVPPDATDGKRRP